MEKRAMVADISEALVGPGAAGLPNRATTPAQAVRDFESLFVETLLSQAGLAQAIDPSDGPQGGVAGEFLVRELAHGLAGQLQLGFGGYLGLSTQETAR
jgi:hypothetical protein